MSQQDLKNLIRSWVKNNQKIHSDFGEIGIEKPLGEGGNALVFDSPFVGGTAIKFLAESVSSPPSTRYARFLDEFRNLIKLIPTGVIVPLYHFGIQEMNGERIPYVVMERCVRTLYDAYKNSRLVSVTEFKQLLERLLEALEVVHAAGVVHRDIKPQNILLRANGQWVIGDFGIAWFDPEIYTKLAVTEKNERLANFEFSAPEQIKRQAYDSPTPSMDLYALGQTLYYCVIGHTIRGSGHVRFSQVAPELSQYDSLIDRLVRQTPRERFQAVKEISQFLEEQSRTVKPDSKTRLRNEFREHLGIFDLALRSAMPGAYRYVQAKNRVEIHRVMSSLASYCKACDLWWFRGRLNSLACPLEKLPEDTWLIEYQECKIIDLWTYRHPGWLTRQHVLVQLAPMPPFGVYASNYPEKIYEESGYYNGRYVTRAEYDDGYASVDEEVIKLDINSLRLRERNLKNDFLILAPNASVFNNNTNDDQSESVYQALLAAGGIAPSLLKPLEELKEPKWTTF